MDKEKYDAEAKEVIDNISSLIIEKFDFEIDKSHSFMKDGVSKVLIKNKLMTYFFWDYKEAQISWGFKERGNDFGHSVDYSYIETKNSFYHSLKSFRKYCFNEEPSAQWDRFIPKAWEKSFTDYFNKWISEFPELFEKGDFAIIKHLEKIGHQSSESMKIERELIDKMLKRENNT